MSSLHLEPQQKLLGILNRIRNSDIDEQRRKIRNQWIEELACITKPKLNRNISRRHQAKSGQPFLNAPPNIAHEVEIGTAILYVSLNIAPNVFETRYKMHSLSMTKEIRLNMLLVTTFSTIIVNQTSLAFYGESRFIGSQSSIFEKRCLRERIEIELLRSEII